MEKIKLGSRIPLYPMSTTLVGASVDGKPNFLTIVWFSMVNFQPPLIAIILNKNHYTNKGIKQTDTFSINFPSAAMISVTDYCSRVSGREANKSTLFNIFYGTLNTAPMIEECPLTLECKLVQSLTFATHELFIGEIIETYTERQFLTHGLPDIKKINPVLYTMYDNNYWKLGDEIGKAMHIGKEFKQKNELSGK